MALDLRHWQDTESIKVTNTSPLYSPTCKPINSHQPCLLPTPHPPVIVGESGLPCRREGPFSSCQLESSRRHLVHGINELVLVHGINELGLVHLLGLVLVHLMGHLGLKDGKETVPRKGGLVHGQPSIWLSPGISR